MPNLNFKDLNKQEYLAKLEMLYNLEDYYNHITEEGCNNGELD